MYKKTFILFVFCTSSILSFGQTIEIPPNSNPTISNILGGSQIDIKKVPYQVSLELLGFGHFCGGSIISDRWILTAAHCLSGQSASDIIVHAGATDQTNNNIGQRIQAQTLYVHPSYNISTLDNDVALIYLSQPLDFNKNVVPIEYANSCNTTLADMDSSKTAYLTGWGITCNNCPVATNLQGVSMPFISQTDAEAINIAYNSNYTLNVSNNMVSFYYPTTGAGPGDSGGPAVINKNGNKIEVGTSSWGYWPKDQLPTMYANIRNYETWIENKLGFSINPAGINLYTKDKLWDMGFEPFSYQYPWTSDDIWVRRQDDSIEVHQNPEYYAQPSNFNYVYVRVINKGCTASNGTEELKLYWAKAATALSWPNYWNGSLSVSGNPLGGLISIDTLPVIQPGDAYIAKFKWQPPNPSNFYGLASDPLIFRNEPHHFCLLTRIVSTTDPMTYPETSNLAGNVLNNNNIAWKNISVIDSNKTNIVGEDVMVGATILVGDASNFGGNYNLEFKSLPSHELPITEVAEVKLTLDAPIWNKVMFEETQLEGVEVFNEEKKQLILTAENSKISNLNFEPNERGLIHVNFNFLVDDINESSEFGFVVVQTDEEEQIVGGELYHVLSPNRQRFYADAGSDVEIGIGDSTSLNAVQIGEEAIYNWYNQEGDLINSDPNITVSPTENEVYILEVIAENDGFKDYDEILVKVKENELISLTPNPATSILSIDYIITNADQAILKLVRQIDGHTSEYLVDLSESSMQINVSDFNHGTYSVILFCDGEVEDYLNLLIQ